MKTAKKRLRHLGQATQLVWESARSWTMLQGAAMAVQGLLPIATLYLTRGTVDAVGVFLIGVPVSSLTGGDVSGHIAASKGKILALEARMTGCAK